MNVMNVLNLISFVVIIVLIVIIFLSLIKKRNRKCYILLYDVQTDTMFYDTPPFYANNLDDIRDYINKKYVHSVILINLITYEII